mmetsp:Transcript_68996/g.179779  ORF Transcript_68996/g.179779 Transcript_68996/m.179779 type:complete len:311 (-) Transcript_68996:32-964(-)
MARTMASVFVAALALNVPVRVTAVAQGLRAEQRFHTAEHAQPEWTNRLQIFRKFMKSTSDTVSHWKVEPAQNTDRVAVTILQPATPDHIAQMAYVIRSNMHRLGPRWALQVFYGFDDEMEDLNEALGNPQGVIWSHMVLQGERRLSLDHGECSWFRLSDGFWGALRPEHEHVLVFESDSLLRRRGCVEEYVDKDYDYVGAPWVKDSVWGAPALGGNGGFSLRRLSSMLAAIRSPEMAKLLGEYSELFFGNEDLSLVELLLRRNATFPPREVATRFSVETVFYPTPCAFHKPWAYLDEDSVQTLMTNIDMD